MGHERAKRPLAPTPEANGDLGPICPGDAVTLRLFGGFRLARRDGSVVHVPLRKGQALLSYLACSPGAPVSREILASLLWGECREHQARTSLRQVICKLNPILADGGAPVLKMSQQLVWLDTDALWIDVHAFEGLLERGTPDALARAADLYTGDFLAGLHVRSSEFDDWRTTQRGRYEERVMRALGDLLMRQHAEGRIDLAIETGDRVLRIDPLREDVHREVMRLYVAQGQRTSALKQFRVCRDLLKCELGVDPDDATTALYRGILADGPDTEPPAAKATEQDLERFAPAGPLSARHPLVGRQTELSALDREFAAAAQTGCRLLLITGEAGVGKTHLIEAFCRRLDGEGVYCMQARAASSEQGLRLAVWANLLGDELTRDPAADRLGLYQTVVRDLRRRAVGRPLVLVLDDLHWADQESLHLLAYAVRHLESRPVLFVATTDPEAASDVLRPAILDLERDGTLRRLDVPPLSRARTLDLCAQVHTALGRKPPSTARISEVWWLSEGNPRIVVECLLQRDGKAGLPETLSRDLQRLLASVSDAARELVDVACVAGNRCRYDVLGHAAGLDEKALHRVMQELAEAGIVRLDDRDLMFARDRIRVARYRCLSRPRRRVLHGAVAQAIAQVQADELARHHRIMAHHWREAGRPVEAARCDVRAGLVELDRGHHSGAGRCFRRALRVACEDHENAAVMAEIEADARLGLAAVAETDGNVDTMADHLNVLDADLDRLDGAGRRAAVLYGLARCHGVSGNDDAALGYTRRAVAECAGDTSNPIWFPAERMLVRPPVVGREADRVHRLLRRRQRRSRTFDLRRSEAEVCATIAVVHGLRGEFAVASAEARTAVHRAEGTGDARLLAACLQVLGMVLTWGGEAPEALVYLDKAAAVADARCDTIRLCALAGHRGHALRAAGRYGDAVRALSGALSKAGRIGTRVYRPLFTAWQAESHFQAGNVEAALRQARTARRLAAEANQPWAWSITLRTLAQALAEPTVGNLPLARRAIDQALTIQRGLGPRFELPYTLSVQARVRQAGLSRRVHAAAI